VEWDLGFGEAKVCGLELVFREGRIKKGKEAYVACERPFRKERFPNRAEALNIKGMEGALPPTRTLR
jgi:hypothetical protein